VTPLVNPEKTEGHGALECAPEREAWSADGPLGAMLTLAGAAFKFGTRT